MKTVYQMTNTKTGMNYVGSTRLPVEDRFCQHLGQAHFINNKVGQSPLSEAIRDFGADSFVCRPLTTPIEDDEIANGLEHYFIKTTHSHVSDNGYNVYYSEIRAREAAIYADTFTNPSPDYIQLARVDTPTINAPSTLYPIEYMMTRSEPIQPMVMTGLGFMTPNIPNEVPPMASATQSKQPLYHVVDNSLPYEEYKRIHTAA